jgi:Zn-dependent M28 family amino/carboxypeptidase
VVLSAHIDHIGIGAPINGDKIYNGAMDDGSGSALVMDIAASIKSHPEKLSRSVIFLLVTAEEKGLLGSKYFAAHPTVPAKSIVADINVDMFLPIVPLKILKIEGIEESDLGTNAAKIAQSMGIKPIADPEPLRNAFIRSDQYSFIKKGVPAVKVDVGFELGTPEQKIFKEWLTNRYHAPSDDVNQPVDLQAAATYEEFTRRLLISTANDPAKPQWKSDSFFRRYAAD